MWGPVALRKRGEAAPKTHRNVFADVALRWAAGLLRQVGVLAVVMVVCGNDAQLARPWQRQ